MIPNESDCDNILQFVEKKPRLTRNIAKKFSIPYDDVCEFISKAESEGKIEKFCVSMLGVKDNIVYTKTKS